MIIVVMTEREDDDNVIIFAAKDASTEEEAFTAFCEYEEFEEDVLDEGISDGEIQLHYKVV
jgi:hypothetical protein